MPILTYEQLCECNEHLSQQVSVKSFFFKGFSWNTSWSADEPNNIYRLQKSNQKIVLASKFVYGKHLHHSFLLSDWKSHNLQLVQLLLWYKSGTILEDLGINTIYCEPLLHYLSCCCFVIKDSILSSSVFHCFNFLSSRFLLPKLFGIVLWPKLQELSSVLLPFLWNISK